jgi:NAD(P)-dependent dehydrogenase (short-subunit alcohol dehydrogenase family)
MPDLPAAFRLDGRTALVTGVGAGIGLATARLLAEAGARLVLCARQAERVHAWARELSADGAEVVAAPGDVGRAEDLRSVLATAEAAFGQVDIVYNNAHANPAWSGQQALAHGHARTELPDKGPLDYSAEDWQAAFDVNVLAPYRLAQALVPHMKQRGRGVIITALSGAAFRPTLPVVPYGTTKAALHMLTRYLAKACAPEVRVNAVCPASISPDGTPWEAHRAHLPAIPLGRLGRPDEVAAAVLYLASDASSYSSGEVLFVDGGRVSTA